MTHPTHQHLAIHAAVLTVSDTRTVVDDKSGQRIQALLEDATFSLADYQIVQDEPAEIARHLQGWCADPTVHAILITGGTGFSARDQTYDTIVPLFEKEMTGFGELFRALSYNEIGAKAMFSRATAGSCQQTAIYVLPGSTNAVTLAMTQLIIPTIQHFVGELQRL